ncbi:MAG: GNAT family N-acetyltransferase [Oscillospiraceae bacterium]|nr:GNAT family N-acetyltransferase [Oscillospiraceae bacterium]
MITAIIRITDATREKLAVCHYGRKMLCCMQAYGFERSFCQFFMLQSDSGAAILMLQNSTLLISSQDDFSGDTDAASELSLFIDMHAPFRVEGCQSLLRMLRLKDYGTLARSVFTLVRGGISPLFDTDEINDCPRLDDVYQILSEGFPNLISYPLWLTDTSHMVRHGFRQCFTYFNVTAATAIYDYNDHVLIGQVATKRAARGKGYARDFLHWIANRLDAQGKTGILYALDIRKSFYEEIGFKLTESEIVWERLHEAEPDRKKGVL